MSKSAPSKTSRSIVEPKALSMPAGYSDGRVGIVELLNAARQAAARYVNAPMTASFWEIGRQIVEVKPKGKRRAGFGEPLIEKLSAVLTQQFGPGFSTRNLVQMRQFCLTSAIAKTLSEKSAKQLPAVATSKSQTASAPLSGSESGSELANAMTLPWSVYERLASAEAGKCRGWQVQWLASAVARKCSGWKVQRPPSSEAGKFRGRQVQRLASSEAGKFRGWQNHSASHACRSVRPA